MCRNAIISQRIKSQDYRFPSSPQTSPELKDLISKILVADPQRRATIKDIIAHPWFSKGLPRGVLEMNDRLVQEGQHAGYQSEAEIREIVDHASETSPTQNRHIDHMIEEEFMQVTEDD